MSHEVTGCPPAPLEAMRDRASEKALRAFGKRRYESERFGSSLTGRDVGDFATLVSSWFPEPQIMSALARNGNHMFRALVRR